jgi:hypothetical protein
MSFFFRTFGISNNSVTPTNKFNNMASPALWTAIASGFQNGLGVWGQERTNKANKNLATDQAEWNIEQWKRQRDEDERRWHMANAYEHPQMQMARLSEAGLNPNLIYGSGSAAAGGTPFSSAKEVKGYDRAEARNVMQGFSAFSDAVNMRYITQQTDNLEVQNQVLHQEAIKKSYETLDKAVGIQRKSFDLGLAKELRDTSIQAAQANAQKAVYDARTSGIESDVSAGTRDARIAKVKKELELLKLKMQGQSLSNKGQILLNKLRDLEGRLNELGLQKGDNFIMRMIAQDPELRKAAGYIMETGKTNLPKIFKNYFYPFNNK